MIFVCLFLISITNNVMPKEPAFLDSRKIQCKEVAGNLVLFLYFYY